MSTSRPNAPSHSERGKQGGPSACLLQSCIAISLMMLVAGVPELPVGLRKYDTRYYTIYTDLEGDVVREAEIRMTKMVEEYEARTKAFTGKITERLPFYLLRNPQDYYTAGGLPGSSGIFTGDRLMAIAGDAPGPTTWSVIQHEGWHQFVDAVIGGDIPVWVNEGLAGYFEEAIFTGDGFIAGVIVQGRLVRIRDMVGTGGFVPFADMMALEQPTWNRQMSSTNYDQAWSMVHFLAHAEGGKYRQRFDSFIQDISRKGLSSDRAWLRSFDADIPAFEEAWQAYWTALPDNPTTDLYAEATVATLTSFLARAYSQGQVFQIAQFFFEAARAGTLRAHPQDRLPEALLAKALSRIDRAGAWSLRREGRGPPTLICRRADGTTLTGKFAVSGGRVKKVTVRVAGPAKGR